MSKVKDLTQGDLTRLLYQQALPIMGTSFVQIAYSFTDMAWLGRLSSEALAAVGVVSVFIWIANSVAWLNKTGCEVTISHCVGSGELTEAGRYASHNVSMSLLVGTLLTIGYALCAEPMVDLYSLEEGVRHDALSYMYVSLIGFPEIFLTATLTGLYNAIGHSKVPFRIMCIGLGCNMLLDPLFIHLFGWGVQGAALATVISQTVVLFLFVRKAQRDKLFDSFPFFVRLRRSYVLRILQVGVPVVLLNVLFAFVSIYMGGVVSRIGGHIGVATMTTGAQIEALTWNTANGVTTALVAIVGQNWAAGHLRRVYEVYRRALTFTLSVGFVGMLAFLLFSEELFSLIVPEREAYIAGGLYLRIVGLSQMFMMLEITTGGLFNGLGKTYLSAGIGIVGTYLRIPIVLLFVSLGWGLEAAWWAICLTSVLKGLVFFAFFLVWRARLQAHRAPHP
ncbi:MATE family efflux transporter [uncultured Porphyromonas sp.]|uniref:MATE family efflux transporter n=1 Tax=uncultured Porphyromonas sp. TaxID=159274 RepID=UPI00262FDBB3|nr:MATE family efflux transporter [uncultured Porphyromonas sp.]